MLYIIINLFLLKIKCEDCETESYYTINGGETTCIEVNNINSGYKLIYGTKELVNICPEGYHYQLGNICYKKKPLNTGNEPDSDGEYKCSGSFYIETIDTFNYYTCYSTDNCPTTFKYYQISDGSNNKECLKSCDGKTIKKETNEDTYIYRCSETCNRDNGKQEVEYEYKETESKIIRYCLDDNKCPQEAKYYYDSEEGYKCLEKCNPGDFSDTNNICVDSCNESGKKIIPDSNQNLCIEGDCPANFPYLYEHTDGESTIYYCLKSCADTINVLDIEVTYLYEKQEESSSSIQKICTGTNPSTPDITYYKDTGLYKWVTDCKISLSGPFHDTDTCRSKCTAPYNCATFDNFECIEFNTDGEYYLDDPGNNEQKICYNECPDYLGRGFFDNNKQCQSCTVGEGFYRSGDKKCYQNCYDIGDDEQYYYNYNTNFCFKNGCNNPLYKYSEIPTTNQDIICYQSCFNITGANFEKDNICYTSQPSNIDQYYYYTIEEGSKTLTKYVKNRYDCVEAGFPYLNGITSKECITNCDDNKYKILPIKNDIGICCEDLNSCKNSTYKYYNDSKKIITTQCKEFIVVDINGNELTSEKNCLANCDNNYCEDIKNKLCYKECKNYYIDSGKKIYVEKCDNYFYKESDNVNKCVDECGIVDGNNVITQHTYYLDTKECIDTCPNEKTTNSFSYKIDTNHQPCLEECKTGEYYYDSTNPKLCVTECDKYYKNNNNDNKLCVENCENGEYIHPGNICSTNECPSTSPFFIKIIKTVNSVQIINKKCLSNCKDENYDYYSVNYNDANFSPNQCMNKSDCQGYIYNGGCYNNCPEGLYISEDNKECAPKCDKNFYLNEGENPRYQCLDACNDNYPYETSSKECVKKCPKNQNYIGKDNKCLTSCENDENKYYIKKIFESDPDSSYPNYECKTNCKSSNNKIYNYGEKECLEECDDYLYIKGDEKICYKNCYLSDLPFSTKNNENKKVCANQCLKEGEKNYLSDKICISKCKDNAINNTIDDGDNSCVSTCNLLSQYKYLQVQSESDDSLHCKNRCENFVNSKNRYHKSNYICQEKCLAPNNYVVEDSAYENVNECLSECPNDRQYMRKNYNDEYICSNEECQEDEYIYMDTKICLENCGDSLYFYQIGTKKYCADSCYFFKDENLYFFEDSNDSTNKKKCVKNCEDTASKYTTLKNHCKNECGDNEYHNENEFICLSKCPHGTTNDGDGKLCKKCETINQYVDNNGNCVDRCENIGNEYKYHNKDEYECLNNCNGKLIEDNVCKDYCETKLFRYEQNCLENCPPDRRFFIESNSGGHINKTCLNDCPQNYPFYNVETVNSMTLFKCTDECKTYIYNPDSNKYSKLCLGEKCNNTYKYYTYDSNNRAMCYQTCPTNYPYYKKEEESSDFIQCYHKCPDDYVHLTDNYQCIQYSECNEEKKIKYNEKECVVQCSKTDKYYVKDGLTFCVDDCGDIPNSIKGSITLKLTYDNKCNESCIDYSEEDETNKLCICKRLFYYDKTTGYKKCLNPDYTLCETVPNYPILKMYENECTNYCNGVLSLSETECYNNSYTCGENEEIKTLTNGDKVCVCKYKYYTITENERNIKKCLSENENCPSSNSLLIKETKECVPECPSDNIQFGKTCILECPSDYTKVGSKCECSGTWYISDNSDLVCINGECPSNKNLYVTDTKECVSSCIGTGSEIYFNKTCVKEDNSEIEGRTKVSSSNDPYLKDISRQYFRCDNLWYYDQKGYDICSDKSSENSCEDINFKYKISATNQCVNKCPDNYYRFNNECLYECKDNLKEINGEYMCECIKLWKYEDEATKKKIVCLSTDVCDNEYLLIKSTNQCIKDDKCPSEYAQFDKTCYNKDECPKELNTKYDEITQKCICEYKWYFDTESETQHCLSENGECPADYQYYNYATKECTKTNTEISENNLYEFNYIFYSNCPENTIIDENNPNKCICDPLLGYWYSEQQEDGKDIYICAQEKCSELKPYNIYQQKECIAECPEENKYLYRGICYDKCPYLTEAGNNNECQLSSVDNDIELENLEKAMTENILELYKKSTSFDTNITTGSVGQKIVTKNATVEFYGVNKKNKGKNDNIKSDLSYIDISDCLEKIYKSNNMKEGADIIILKFDVNKIPNKYLINPVEYKFINSENGQELDASVCEHNSIRISYPVHDLISRYDKLTKNRRKLEYMKISLTSNNKESLREKLDKGKEIFDEYPAIDIFDINAKIYSDICMAVEVDGKDLVLEDRIDYFYPQLSLCENNCTYNRTDFVNERVYCDCSYKTEFDFDREYSSSFEINSNQVKNAQNGNSNIAVLKCISNLKSSKSISKNYGFIYSIIVIFIEIVLFCVIAFYGIRALLNKIKSKTNKSIENDYITEENILKTNNIKKTDEDIKTSERNLENPPKKKKNFDIEFIPQEYLFLFFNQGEKNSIKKIERDNVPFKTKYNTRILLEKKKGVNYDNVTPSGPFPPGQNVLVIVDNMDEDINDYLGGDDDSSEEEKRKKKKEKKSKKKEDSLEINPKPKLYKKTDYSISDYDPSDENYSIYYLDEEDDSPHEKGFLESLKANQRFITRKYEIAAQNKNINFVELLCTEILDKIYITKILLFTKKFQIFSLQLSVYFLCHILLLVFITLFFDIKTIKKIWQKENYPGLGYYLGYGFAACLIVWIIYRIFLCLLTNNDKIKEILKIIHYNNKFNMKKEKIIHKKFENLEWKIKFKFGFYTLIQLILLTFSFIYLTVFSTVYIGTQTKALKEYGIALIEILIIKIIYAIALASMRYVSLTKHKKGLYNVVLFMSTYLV